MNIDTSKPILITGANGYIASWIVKCLLEKGCVVHAAVRDPSNKERVGHLENLAHSSQGTLRLFKADLLTPHAYTKSMQECELVIHTASPVLMNSKHPQKDLIDPALTGTTQLLDTVNATPSVKRVVLTSSVAAIYHYPSDLMIKGVSTLTEEDWNTGSSVGDNPYAYSKTLAEQHAWKVCKQQSNHPRWDLVTINPGFVVGPTLSGRMETSLELIKNLGDGSMKYGTIDLNMSLVDVQDVALAHIQAGFTPSAKGRHIVVERRYNLMEISQALATYFNNAYPFPKRVAPKWLVYLIAPLLGLSRNFIAHSVGYDITFDNSYSKQDLSMEYHSAIDAVNASFQQMIDLGIIPLSKTS